MSDDRRIDGSFQIRVLLTFNVGSQAIRSHSSQLADPWDLHHEPGSHKSSVQQNPPSVGSPEATSKTSLRLKLFQCQEVPTGLKNTRESGLSLNADDMAVVTKTFLPQTSFTWQELSKFVYNLVSTQFLLIHYSGSLKDSLKSEYRIHGLDLNIISEARR